MTVEPFHWKPDRCPDCGVHRTALGNPRTPTDRFGWVYCARCDEYKLPNGDSYPPGDEDDRVETLSRWLYGDQGLTLAETRDELEIRKEPIREALLSAPDIEYPPDPTNSLRSTWEPDKIEFRYQSGRPIFYDTDSEHMGARGGYSEWVWIHHLVAIANYGFDEVAGRHISFENGCTMDTSHDNVVITRDIESETPDGWRDELLGWIKAFYAEYGIAPTTLDMRGWPGPGPGAYADEFGGIPNAIEAADVPMRAAQADHPLRNGPDEASEST